MSYIGVDNPFTNFRLWNYLKLFRRNINCIYYELDEGKLNGNVSGYYDLIGDLEKEGYIEVNVLSRKKLATVRLTIKGVGLKEEIEAFRNL